MKVITRFLEAIGLNPCLFAGLICTAIGCGANRDAPLTLPFFNGPDLAPEWIERGSDRYGEIHRIGHFLFVNQDGEPITGRDFEDRIYVASFFFTTCPGICPAMTSNLAKLQEAFKEDTGVLLLSHTVTPEKDTVPVLKNYAWSHGVISGKWHLVTGSREDIYDLARNAYFADEDEDAGDFLHTENLILVDKQKRIRGVYSGTQRTDIRRLIEDIEVLKREYGRGPGRLDTAEGALYHQEKPDG